MVTKERTLEDVTQGVWTGPHAGRVWGGVAWHPQGMSGTVPARRCGHTVGGCE